MKKVLHMLIGGTGTGKSTFAEKKKNNDGIKVFRPDEIEKLNSKLSTVRIDKIVKEQLDKQIETGETFILDGKCLDSEERRSIVEKATNNGYIVYAYDFGPGSIESLNRRIKDSKGKNPHHWRMVHESDKTRYNSPDLEEGFDKIYIQPK